MSRSRKRTSKWDLTDPPQLLGENTHGDGWTRESSLSLQGKEPYPGRHASDITGHRDRRRVSGKSGNNEECTKSRDGDESYSLKMSPDCGWSRSRRGRSRSHSRSRSRSRSRSPGRGFKWESSIMDRNKTRSGVSNQACRDFASGRCRRGERCQFLHDDNQNYEDRRHLEGDPMDSRDRPSRYSHHGASDGFEIIREGMKGRSRDVSSERVYDRESRRGGEIPCKFYAAGNCRNGRNCRFSHHGHSYSSAAGRSRDDRWRVDHKLDNTDQLTGRPSWRDSNAVLDSAKAAEVNSRNVGAPAIRESRHSMDDKWDYKLRSEEESLIGPTNIEKAVDGIKSELVQSRPENSGPELSFSRPMDTEKWLGELDKPSPWISSVRPPNNVIQEDPEYVSENTNSGRYSGTYIPAHEHDTTLDASRVGPPNNAKSLERTQSGLIPSTHTNGPQMGVSGSLDSEKWLGELEKSSPWNCTVRSPNSAFNGKAEYLAQNSLHLSYDKKTLPIHEQDVAPAASRDAPTMISNAAESTHDELIPLRKETNGPQLGGSSSVDTEKWLDGMEKASPWNSGMRSPNTDIKGGSEYLAHSSYPLNFSRPYATHEQGLALEASRVGIENNAGVAESINSEVPCRAENNGPELGVSRPMESEKWLGDMEKSSPWNRRVRSPNNCNKGGPEYMAQSSHPTTTGMSYIPTHEQHMAPNASNQMYPTASSFQPVIYENSFPQHQPCSRDDSLLAFQRNEINVVGPSPSLRTDLNLSSDVLPHKGYEFNGKSLNSQHLVAQGQLTLPSGLARAENTEISRKFEQFLEENPSKSMSKVANPPQIPPGALPIPNMASNEQIAQLTNLSASLAQLLENGQQLPQLYAALNSTAAMMSHPAPPNPVGLVTSAATASFQPNPASGFREQHSNRIESINPGELKDRHAAKPGVLEDLNQAKRETNCAVIESNGMGVNESKKSEEEALETGLCIDTDENGKVDGSKKNKDGKGVRAFKFALAEFVKELLKPTWKDGQINKDVYKIIVKKVVDKVTGTMQGANVPQNQEKINQYLSFSKPKLTKLVQAYVERHQKS